VNTLLLLLLDTRAPAGAHHHSGGMEAAVGTGLVAGLSDLEDFCQTRLRTSARVAAAFAASACRLQADFPERAPLPAPADAVASQGDADPWTSPVPWPLPAPWAPPDSWAELDAEFDVRTPSAAMRAASRQLGGGLARLLRSLQPDTALPWARGGRPAPHHPLVLGAGIHLAGGSPELAARAAALAACAGPASAVVRLLGLDPFAVQAMLARLAPGIDECARRAAADAAGPPSSLPADGAPALDLLADFHLTSEVRLFAS
jgi:urease accessory protein